MPWDYVLGWHENEDRKKSEVDWFICETIADRMFEAFHTFSEDATSDNATCIVREVIENYRRLEDDNDDGKKEGRS